MKMEVQLDEPTIHAVAYECSEQWCKTDRYDGLLFRSSSSGEEVTCPVTYRNTPHYCSSNK